jgi:hypothetical protein
MGKENQIYYHFCDFSICELENVANRQLYFSPASSFNDPQDSHLCPNVKELLSDPKIRHLLHTIGVDERRFDSFLQQTAFAIDKCIYVSSFAKPDDPDLATMWGYYGGKSRGMRIAYDFSHFRPQKGCLDIEKNLTKVNYERNNLEIETNSNALIIALLGEFLKEKDPKDQKADKFFVRVPYLLPKVIKNYPGQTQYLVSQKMSCWKPEREYRLIRILNPRQHQLLKYENKNFLQEIALGPSASPAQIKLAQAFCKGIDEKCCVDLSSGEASAHIVFQRGCCK